MKMTIDAVYMSAEMRVGQKDPTRSYYPCLLAVGTETLEPLCADVDVFNRLIQTPQFTPMTAVLEYNARFKSFRLADFSVTQKVVKA